jgi:hypothetical protein
LDGVLFDRNQMTLIQFPNGKIGSYAVPGTVTSVGDSAFNASYGLTGGCGVAMALNVGVDMANVNNLLVNMPNRVRKSRM